MPLIGAIGPDAIMLALRESRLQYFSRVVSDGVEPVRRHGERSATGPAGRHPSEAKVSSIVTAPTKQTINQPTVDQEKVSAILTVIVPAARVFAVLADPAAHAAIDGTGWVQEPVDRAPLTEAGQVFRMGMYHRGHPNGDYQTVNKVVVFDTPLAIGWLTGYQKDDGDLEFGGWIWRYDLVPLSACETEVTLSYDWSRVPQFIRDRGIQFPPFGPEHLTNSLHHLAVLATPTTSG
jgi:hypothetical protein